MNHKRISILSTLFILVMVTFLAGSVPAAAQAEKIYFSGEDCPIAMGAPEKQWIGEDGVLHLRGIPLTTRLDYDPFNGFNYLVVNQDMDLATGAVHVYGSVEIHPDGIQGVWLGHFSTKMSPEGVVEGRAVIHGTGELEGKFGINNISSPDAPDPACFNQNTASNGYILVP